ncbi:zinc finger protein ZAT5-like [Henckelia pumila]|uniref:zinc finger protein ZAT5-like n=1 Tax=Henckelia pumila TaxID=405737 RepID=UPI003C6E0D88
MQIDQEVIMVKGKRSKRPRPSSPLALTILAANSYSTGGGFGGGGSILSVESSGCSDNSGELTPSSADEEEEYMANCLILLSGGGSRKSSQPRAATEHYQCKTCNKSFPSFQALGGHRSSHKKNSNKTLMLPLEEKPPLFSRNKQESLSTLSLPLSNIPSFDRNKCRVHECSLCGAEFASGQALGGHMRRHRPIPPPHAAAASSEFRQVKRPRNLLSLDLNLPAAQEDHDCSDQSKLFPFGSKEEVIVFSNSSLIDCHY